MKSIYIPYPEAKTSTISVPYRSGDVDLTEATGYVPYKDRKGLKLEFILYCGSYAEWKAKMKQIADLINGRSVKMICDDDPDHYYIVRLKVDTTRNRNIYSKITMSGTADPFRYDRIASNEPWEWDSFNFVTGVIRDAENVEVDSDHPLTIAGAGEAAVPEFIVNTSVGLKLKHNGKTYPMLAIGRYRFPQIKIGKDDVTFTFEGSGKISVAYRGRYL